jgi:DNA-binding transcriptional LysR family regulator
MQTDHIHYLTVLSDTLSVNQAARILNLTPSYMSKVLKNAEKELGITLFSRTHEGLVPAEGAEGALEALRDIDRIYSSIQQPQVNEADITGNYIYYCRPALSAGITPQLFQKITDRFPAITMQYAESNEKQTIELVSQTPHTIGLVVKMKDDPESHLPETVRLVKNIFATHLAVLMSQKHPLAKNRSISLARLLQSDLIFYDSYRDIESNSIYQYLSHQGKPHIKYCINSLPTFLSMLEKGNCLTCVGLNGVYGGGLKVLPLRENIDIGYSLIYNAADDDSPVIRYFIETITQLFAQT